MNNLSDDVKSYFIILNSSEYQQELYKLCLKSVKAGNFVVLVTSDIYDFSELVLELILSKEELKNFILMYYKSMDEVSSKLLLQYSWSKLPTMVAVDLSQLLKIEQSACPSSDVLVQKVALCIVSLLVYLESVVRRLHSMEKCGNLSNVVHGLLIIQPQGEYFGNTEIQTLKDLYFYKTELYQNFDAVKTLLFEPGEF